MKSEILHGELSEIIKRIFVLHSNFMAQRSLFGMRIGVIGAPSGWLLPATWIIACQAALGEWNTPMSPLTASTNITLKSPMTKWAKHAPASPEKRLPAGKRPPEDMIKAMRLYRAIRKIVDEDRLSALTLSCFRLIEQTGTTGCLALSLLNDEGIIAGCEGDLQSIFTMLTAKVLTGKPAFMANPSMINARTNEIILAHCTIGIAQTEQFIIRNHFETESGIGIQGILPTGDVTIVKCGGECLDEYYLGTGTLIENTNYINMCRTQVRIKMNAPAEYFLRNPLGNHHILLHGNHEQILDEFLQSNGCKRIE